MGRRQPLVLQGDRRQLARLTSLLPHGHRQVKPMRHQSQRPVGLVVRCDILHVLRTDDHPHVPTTEQTRRVPQDHGQAPACSGGLTPAPATAAYAPLAHALLLLARGQAPNARRSPTPTPPAPAAATMPTATKGLMESNAEKHQNLNHALSTYCRSLGLTVIVHHRTWHGYLTTEGLPASGHWDLFFGFNIGIGIGVGNRPAATRPPFQYAIAPQ